jgi:hypothetical protein
MQYLAVIRADNAHSREEQLLYGGRSDSEYGLIARFLFGGRDYQFPGGSRGVFVADDQRSTGKNLFWDSI